jgi:hypothetical protein
MATTSTEVLYLINLKKKTVLYCRGSHLALGLSIFVKTFGFYPFLSLASNSRLSVPDLPDQVIVLLFILDCLQMR